MLSKKFITRLLYDDFRNRKLVENSRIIYTKFPDITDYARYIVDQQIVNRSEQFKNDKHAYYGFSPISPIGYVSKQGEVHFKFFEMNVVNHFLQKMEGEKAVDVVRIILAEMTVENKDVANFNIGVITKAELQAERMYKTDIDKKEQKTEDVNE